MAMEPHPRDHAAEFRFYAELNDFLPTNRRQCAFPCTFNGNPAVKDLIESLGVPHGEVDVILVNGVSVGFGHAVQDGDRVAVYPVFEAIDVASLQHLRPSPLRTPRFVLDGHLGKLARALRLLGIDAADRRDVTDVDLIARARNENRIILSRDRQLLKSRSVTHGVCIRSTDPRAQLVEVLDRFDLRAIAKPFSRCTVCNGEMASVAPEDVMAEAPPRVRASCREYYRCQGCGKLYWKGTHVERLETFVRWALRREE